MLSSKVFSSGIKNIFFKVVSESLASILLNSSNLLRIDLDGVNVLAPFLVTALEAVLPEKEVTLNKHCLIKNYVMNP